MNLAEAVAAALVLMVGASGAAGLWSQALRSSWDLARREEQLNSLDALILASEGKARQVAESQAPSGDCEGAAAQLLVQLRTLPAPGTTLTVPTSSPGTIHLRWEGGGLRRERLWSLAALGLCQEGGDGA